MSLLQKRAFTCLSVVAAAGLLLASCGDDEAAPIFGPDLFVDAAAAGGGDGSSAAPFQTIQEAINAATAGDLISVAAGDYVEDLLIDKSLTLVGVDKATTTVTGVAVRPSTDWPLLVSNIYIHADDVTISDLTIKSPVVGATEYSGCIALAGQNVEIAGCDFEVATGDISQAIQTYAAGNEPDPGLGSIAGLHIHDCTFTHLAPAVGTAQYEGIYINPQTDAVTAADTIIIENNTFSGALIRAITTERSSTIIRGNTISTDATILAAGTFPTGIRVSTSDSSAQDNVTIQDNVILAGANPFEQGIEIGNAAQLMSGITLSGNMVIDCNVVGIEVNCDLAADTDIIAGGNWIAGNADGVAFTGTANSFTVDATGNWWGAADGPSTDGSSAATGSGDTVSLDVDFGTYLTDGPWEYLIVATDGGGYVVMKGPFAFASYYDAAGGPLPGTSMAVMVGTPGGAPSGLITFKGQTPATYTVNATDDVTASYMDPTGQHSVARNPIGSGSVVVTASGAVGARVEGTFDIVANVFADGAPTATTVNLTGVFSVIRGADDNPMF